MSATTDIVMMTCLMVTFDGNCGHALCQLNQLKFAGRGASWNATVHLQRSKKSLILGNNTFRTESMQTKKRCVHGNSGKLACIVPRQGNERNHVANLTIESTADFIEYFREGRAGRNRLKELFFRAQ